MNIDVSSQAAKANQLRDLHHRDEPLLLVNAWDALSARIVESLGFPAVATGSAGVALARGYADGEKIGRAEMMRAVADIVRVVRVPVTADLEAGYGKGADDAAATARAAIEVGVVGLNFEDTTGDPARPLISIEEQVERIRAMRAIGDAVGVPLVINARTDVFLQHVYDNDGDALAETIRRGKAFAEAGADGFFVPAVTNAKLIREIVGAVDLPLNVLAAPTTPKVAELRALGVHRVSLGSGSTGYAMAMFKKAALDVRDRGEFGFLAERIPYADLNALFSS
jgi:2-methylisocitrate lyase-like PEP mutase family enzyme